jgi:uncharacterized membrane protein YphA (DoxX/SURF4 family)
MNPKLPRQLERFGLAFCFASIGIWEIVDPVYWFGYLPSFAMKLGDPALLVRVHGVFLTLVAAAVLLGLYLRIASGIAVLMLLEIVAALALESGFSEILLRDVAILALAGAIFADTFVHPDAKRPSADRSASPQ